MIFLLFSLPVGGTAHYDIGIGKYFEKNHLHEHKVCSASSTLADCSISAERTASPASSLARYRAGRFSGENPDYEINHVHLEQSSELVASNQNNVQFFTSRLQQTVLAVRNTATVESVSDIYFSPKHSPLQTRAPPSV